MTIFVGCSGLPIKRARYYEILNACEVLPAQDVPPRAANARHWAEEAPEGFVYSMVASRFFSIEPDPLPPGLEGTPSDYGGMRLTKEVVDLYERTIEGAVALGAKVLVFATPSRIGPSLRGKEALAQFFRHVDRHGLRFAWEPHGPWEPEEIAALCTEHELIQCVDPLRDPIPEADLAYARLGPFAAMGRSLADDELERIVEALEPFEEAYCFFSTERAFSDARRMRELLAS
jgi:uncharacterized protein YecE (DUF72 family)